jgi:ribosomal protein RSM22 (predicted rRNA methylase)
MLQPTLTALTDHLPRAQLREATERLSLRYRHYEKPYLRDKLDYFAYLITRLPATLAAIEAVFKEIPDNAITSFLDLGAGPGTGYLAAQKRFPLLKQATLLETDPEFIAIGKQLIADPVDWQQTHLPSTLLPHDVVLMSYSLGEIPESEQIVSDAFAACQQFLVLIEPGTPEGYARIITARKQLLALGAFMVAPCPNYLPCPMTGNDWCHFPARVERSSLHRQLKSGTLGFEDEKFSYLIVAKEKVHVQFTLCKAGVIEQKIVSKKDNDLYKKCRKLDWGDVLD